MNNLLVIDWDYFFPTKNDPHDPEWMLYDWSHAESQLYIDILWPIRASGFLNHGLDLPMVNDQWQTFWDRFDFTPNAKLYFGESNSFAANKAVERGITGEVWLFDAHHDCGYKGPGVLPDKCNQGYWSCEDWMILYGWKVGFDNLHVRYPRWKTWAFKEEPKPYAHIDREFDGSFVKETPRFSKVFVCHSGAWTPPWCDEQYTEFLNLGPFSQKIDLGSYPREFDLEAAKALAAAHAEKRKTAIID